jgi:ABC-2 type transport system ATP-binding protein
VEVKKRIGYLPESVPLYGDLSVDEYLSFIADARLIPGNLRKKAIAESITACGLDQVRAKRIETLSKGYKQRVGLAQAIVHDPPILILDEPTTGLDPNQIIEIRELIKSLGKRKTVILSTHILQEVEAVCSRVLILNKGRIAAQGTPEEISGAMRGGDTWELVLKGAEALAAESGLSRLNLDCSAVKTEAQEGGFLQLSFFVKAGSEGELSVNTKGERIFDWAVSEGYKILSMNRKRLSIEDIFVHLTNEEGDRS